jgi:hypothetical protein
MQKLLKFAQGVLVANSVERFGHLKIRPNFLHMVIGSFFAAAILLIHFHLFHILDISALVAVSFFNLLFVFLLFPLEGTLLRKIVLLFAGNSVGVLWYILQFCFEDVFFFLNSNAFRMIFLVAKPLVDFVWIVSVWSLSLSVLASYKRKTERLEKT